MDKSSEDIQIETDSLPKAESIDVESLSVQHRYRFPFFPSLNEPEALESRTDYEAVHRYRQYVHHLRAGRQRSLLVLILILAALFVASLIGASIYLSRANRITYDLNQFIGNHFETSQSTKIADYVTIELFLFVGCLLLIFYAIIGLTIDNLRFGSILRSSSDRLKELELAAERNSEEDRRTNLLDPMVRLESLYQEYRKIAEASGRVFFESTKRYDVAQKLRRDIGSHLEYLRQDPTVKTDLLNEIQYLLGSFKEIIDREKREQYAQRLWQIFNIIVIIFYITSLTAIMLIAWPKPASSIAVSVPFISVPVWALIWGALGSLSAILYKFYIVKRRVKFSTEFQWLIARPIIGILMSAVAYLAVTSGLILLGAESSNSVANELDASSNAIRFTAIVCFLAGFSDRVYLGIINLLVSKTLNLEKDNISPPEDCSVADESVHFYERVLMDNSSQQEPPSMGMTINGKWEMNMANKSKADVNL